MDTTDIANRITAAAIQKFAGDNDIASDHLTCTPGALTPGEVMRATRALGFEVIFNG